MRAIFKLWLSAITLTLPFSLTVAQTPDTGLGYLRFANATGFEGAVKFELDGQTVTPSGYRSGQVTGTVGFPEKVCAIKISHELLGEAQTAVQIKPAMVTAVLALAKRDEKDPLKVKLAMHVITSPENDSSRLPQLTLMQTTPLETLDLLVGDKPCSLTPFKPDELIVTKSMGQFISVTYQSKRVCSLNFHDPADTVLVLYADSQGLLKHISFSNIVR